MSTPDVDLEALYALRDMLLGARSDDHRLYIGDRRVRPQYPHERLGTDAAAMVRAGRMLRDVLAGEKP